MMMPSRRFLAITSIVLCSLHAPSQQVSQPTMNMLTRISKAGQLTCPGGFPTDLSVINCSYSMSQRFQDFVGGSVSDQAILGAVGFGLYAQAIQSPSEWKRTWDGYGRRVGVRYNQAIAKGAAEFLVGAIFDEDPRHVSYRDDPHLVLSQRAKLTQLVQGQAGAVLPAQNAPGVRKRVVHALYDSVSDLHSQDDGEGPRRLAYSRFVGAFASGYGGYAWYKGPENTFGNAGLRAAQSFGTDVAASFYKEFSPDLIKLLGSLVKRGRQKNS